MDGFELAMVTYRDQQREYNETSTIRFWNEIPECPDTAPKNWDVIAKPPEGQGTWPVAVIRMKDHVAALHFDKQDMKVSWRVRTKLIVVCYYQLLGDVLVG